MLNYETLLSSYDDKLTLMQWLKKVEEALKDASATSFDVIKTGNATLKFAITFEDGTSLVSGEIVLQQGESVASGDIRNGHLFLTLTNGQELDCGSLFNGEIPNMQVRALEVTGGLILGSDANAAIGGDLVVNGLTEVQSLLAYGDVDIFDKIVDVNDHKRFIESADADIEILESDFTKSYAKWSLSGTHLMIVVAGTFPASKTFTQALGFNLCNLTIPSWVGNKLYAVDDVLITSGARVTRSNNAYILETELFNYLIKAAYNKLQIRCVPTENKTLVGNSYVRFAFDLLVDNA